MATLPGQPGVRHLFRKSLKNDSANNTCLTCRDNCYYSENIISPLYDAYVQVVILYLNNSLQEYLQHCLGPNIPSTHIFSLPDNSLIWTMDNNTRVQQQVQHIVHHSETLLLFILHLRLKCLPCLPMRSSQFRFQELISKPE